jgi:lysine 2,3-aminomutase
MIPHWREIQKANIRSWEELRGLLELDESSQGDILKHASFPLNLPRRLAEKIAKNNLHDPILKQFLPLEQEKNHFEGFVKDPVADLTFKKSPKLLQKYCGRALLLTTSSCAMHCRFCFRQNFPYETEVKNFDKELSILKEDPSLSEVILSGGDPLSLSNDALKELFLQLSSIPHLQRIRFHTRFPIGIPERIDSDFINLLKITPLSIIFVIHVNCAQELDADIFAALKKIQCLGIPVLSQSVLLKGVNDSFEALQELFLCLINQGVIPYYLHQLDRVSAAAHFEQSEETGLALMESLRASLPGYAVPRYVREIPNRPYKTLLYTQRDSKFG